LIARKQQDGISPRSINQLQQRTQAKIDMLGADFAAKAVKFR